MKENRINAIIAITALVAAVLMAAALSYAIGKWSLGGSRYDLVIRFPNATGIASNTSVKYAGATVGRVKEVRLIPRKDQTQDPVTKMFNCIEVVVEINQDLEIGEDATVEIKQDGIGISAKYVLITPGPDPNSKALADGAVVQGEMPFDLSNLIQPAGEALEKANGLITQLGPVLNRLDGLSQKLETDLPPLMDNANKFLQNGNSVLGNLSTPDSKQRINDVLANLRVATDNLKVVSSNAKALTLTLAEKPWRVMWGGPTVQPPPESDVLKSDNVIPLKADVDVTPAPADTNAPPPDKKKPVIAQP
jgi:phospholipid/cholesterol/gamma-HCH transport system substrate-binding protein